MQKRTTMTDIAKALGLSQTLVSFVLSGRKDMGISHETKIKVLKTAEEMGYCSRAASKMLKLGRTGFIALVFAKNPGENILDIIGGINASICDYGYSLIVPGNPKKGIDTKECLKLIGEERVDGFIIFGNNETFEKELSSVSIPFQTLSDSGEKELGAYAKSLCESILSADIDSSSIAKSPKTSKPIKRTKATPKKTSAAKSEPEIAPTKKENPVWLL